MPVGRCGREREEGVSDGACVWGPEQRGIRLNHFLKQEACRMKAGTEVDILRGVESLEKDRCPERRNCVQSHRASRPQR